ncbi:hypothetical protein B0H14DRAFT_2920949 [Mycena olivaceomarginata]|nr:hypothetical protein B0H14DRAFT_2920949 [Mycena olivaceomarginata]
MEGWRPPPGQPQPLPSPALSDGSADGGDGERREGLLRPGLAVLLPASHSTRSLGDHVDYSRPIGARVNVRMESAATFVTMESVDECPDPTLHDPGSSRLPPPASRLLRDARTPCPAGPNPFNLRPRTHTLLPVHAPPRPYTTP